MAFDIKAIRDGIYAKFVADSDLKTALGGDSARRLYKEKAPQNVDSPYAIYQYIVGSPDPTFTSDGEIMTFQFSIFNKSDSPLGTATIDDVIKKLLALYDDAALTISGYTSIAMTRGISGYLPPIDDIQMFTVDYELMIELV